MTGRIQTAKYLILALAALIPVFLLANGGHTITVEISNYDGEQAYLAYYLGPNQYVLDTAAVQEGVITFHADDTLESGFYLVVFPPDNRYFHVLIDQEHMNIRVVTDGESIEQPSDVQGSPDTRLFYEYAEFLSEQRPVADRLRGALDEAEGANAAELERQLEALNNTVKAEQRRIMDRYPQSLTAMMIRANLEFKAPEFTGTQEEIERQNYQYYREHYFDNVSLEDPRVVRTPYVHDRITHYIENLTYQHPDSINETLDYILGHFEPGGESFRVYLIYFLNKYAKSNIVGMDAVYVHLVNEYYAKGKAPWTEEEQLNKIIENARKLEPILIGKTAPDLTMKNEAGESVTLHKVNAEYKVLFFWDPECGHCKKSIPDLKKFYEDFRDRGVEIYAVCTKLKDGVPECWETIRERGMGEWINVADAFLRSRYKQIYDVRVTPKIFILDSDNEIVMKGIGAERLSEIMERLISMEESSVK